MKRLLQQNWSRCSWEAQLLLAAFGVTIIAHLLILSMVVVLGTR